MNRVEGIVSTVLVSHSYFWLWCENEEYFVGCQSKVAKLENAKLRKYFFALYKRKGIFSISIKYKTYNFFHCNDNDLLNTMFLLVHSDGLTSFVLLPILYAQSVQERNDLTEL